MLILPSFQHSFIEGFLIKTSISSGFPLHFPCCFFLSTHPFWMVIFRAQDSHLDQSHSEGSADHDVQQLVLNGTQNRFFLSQKRARKIPEKGDIYGNLLNLLPEKGEIYGKLLNLLPEFMVIWMGKMIGFDGEHCTFHGENDGWCFSQWDGTLFHILRQASLCVVRGISWSALLGQPRDI